MKDATAENVSKITCASRSDGDEYNPREMYDCSVQYENGRNEIKEAYELNINTDAEITSNPNVGEVHITPNSDDVKVVEDRGDLRVTDMEKIIKGKN